jgi:hypothetical protein
MKVPAILIAISSPKVSLKVSLTFPVLSSRSCCLLLHPLMPLPAVLSFLRCSCSLTSQSLTPILLSWCICLSPLKHPSFRGSSCNIIPARSLTTVSLPLCRNSTAGHDQLLPGPTTALGPLLQLSVTPYS